MLGVEKIPLHWGYVNLQFSFITSFSNDDPVIITIDVLNPFSNNINNRGIKHDNPSLVCYGLFYSHNFSINWILFKSL